MRVKICGISSEEEAKLALSSGADALGFLMGLEYETNDSVTEDQARSIIFALPPFVSSVLVTHRADVSWIMATCTVIGANTVQVHRRISLETLRDLRAKLPRTVKLIQAVHVEGADTLRHAEEVTEQADALLLDTKTENRLGGTGLTHDWNISSSVVRSVKRPVVLAGGLNPDNIEAAVRTVRPFAVDVNSGVEDEHGRKSPQKLRDFVRRAHKAWETRDAGRGASAG